MDKLVDVIKDGEIVRMSEARAVSEDLFVLRKVIEPERGMYDNVEAPERKELRKQEMPVKSVSRLEKWRAGKSGIKSNEVINELVNNFHWEIAKARRGKGISRKHLADGIGVSEEEIRTIEFGELVKDDFVLISKIESFLGISLRKEKKPEANFAKIQRMEEEKREAELEKQREAKREKFIGSEIEISD